MIPKFDHNYDHVPHGHGSSNEEDLSFQMACFQTRHCKQIEGH